MKIWYCKIGEVPQARVPSGADHPMREAVANAYQKVTGELPTFIFSGWAAELTEHERAAVENREPYAHSRFPFLLYDDIVARARGIVIDRDQKGRNEIVPFLDSFPHGHQDISFELKRRVDRILGAERRNEHAVALGDAMDLINYAIFYVMKYPHRIDSVGEECPASPSDRTKR